jgi:DNA adenine methylase
MNPLLKWAGGKRWLIPELHALYNDQRLVEPFVGGMAVALGLQPKHALLNDVNPHLINLYRQLQNGLTPCITMANDKDTYLIHRWQFNHLIDCERYNTAEAANLFYYLNRTGFNGLCRFNKQGFYNVPFGKYTTITYSDFAGWQEQLAPWQLTCGDFAALDVQPDDFIYADPPYDCEFTSYSAGGFSWDDQVRLVEWLAKHRGTVAASNQATPRILELYKALGFTIRLLDAPRRISCNGDRKPVQEMLAIKGLG